MHDSVAAGDMVITTGGVVGRMIKRGGDYPTLATDEEKEATMRTMSYTVNQKIGK